MIIWTKAEQDSWDQTFHPLAAGHSHCIQISNFPVFARGQNSELRTCCPLSIHVICIAFKWSTLLITPQGHMISRYALHFLEVVHSISRSELTRFMTSRGMVSYISISPMIIVHSCKDANAMPTFLKFVIKPTVLTALIFL